MISSTVLLVDRAGASRDRLQVQLKNEGYQVIATDTGYEAIQLMAALQIDVIVLEWEIQDWAAAEILYQAVKWAERIPAILYTSRNTVIKDYIVESADVWLLKSPDVTPLLAALRNVLSDGTVSQLSDFSRATDGAGCWQRESWHDIHPVEKSEALSG